MDSNIYMLLCKGCMFRVHSFSSRKSFQMIAHKYLSSGCSLCEVIKPPSQMATNFQVFSIISCASHAFSRLFKPAHVYKWKDSLTSRGWHILACRIDDKIANAPVAKKAANFAEGRVLPCPKQRLPKSSTTSNRFLYISSHNLLKLLLAPSLTP